MQRKGNYKIWEHKLEMILQSCKPALGRQGQGLQTWGQHDLTYTHITNKNETKQDKTKTEPKIE